LTLYFYRDRFPSMLFGTQLISFKENHTNIGKKQLSSPFFEILNNPVAQDYFLASLYLKKKTVIHIDPQLIPANNPQCLTKDHPQLTKLLHLLEQKKLNLKWIKVGSLKITPKPTFLLQSHLFLALILLCCLLARVGLDVISHHQDVTLRHLKKQQRQSKITLKKTLPTAFKTIQIHNISLRNIVRKVITLPLIVQNFTLTAKKIMINGYIANQKLASLDNLAATLNLPHHNKPTLALTYYSKEFTQFKLNYHYD
jgi:hypothetical protein